MTRAQAEIDIKAIRSVLQERQLKMMLDHDSSRRAKKARPLVVGERCHVLGPGNKWIDAFVTGITDSGRSYETQVEATGKQLTRNRSHIRPRGPDIPHMHASLLQRNAVPSAASDENAPSERENLMTRAQAEIDIKAIRSVLQERQLKMMLDHDSSRRAKKARPLVVGERCHVLGPGNKWIDAFVTGITDSGRSYETQVEATGKQLTRNRSHIRPRGPDIPHMHASLLQRNAVPSAASDENAPSERENSVISGRPLVTNGQKTVLSANRKGSIKQTNTSQVLVSETVPDRRVQPSRQAKMTRFGDNPVTSTVSIPPRRQPGRDTSTRNRRNFKLNVTDPDLLIPIKQTVVTKRHSDLREPQPSSSDSQPASSQPVSETTTSKSSVSLPSSPSGSSCTESTSTSGTNSNSSSETSSESSSQPSSNASSPETSSSASTSRSTSPELLEMERSFNSLLTGTRDRQSHPVTRSQMDNLRDQQQRIAVLKQVASQLQNQPQPVSAPPVANMPLPPYPRRHPSDKGSKNQVQAENANAPRKSSDSETDRLQDIQEEPRRRIGPSRVKELAKFFTPTSDEEENSRVNNRTRRKKLFEPKKEEESEK